ncbi:OTU domain-containing protein 4 [Platichthys flesus]|uniref:OTU domain-containing protein 4 n=1 Tax=Platichthys flesus TaxID=8260 RepID=UPI002DBF1D92|nr:OTU domain-containing protein 4 [Platichthys flesus]
MEGSRHTASEERGAEKLMDDYLRSIGFHRKKIAKDGSCLFRAVAEQVLHCQSLHTKVRTKCVEFLKQNRENYEAFIEGDFEQYLCKLKDPQQWVGEVEINALAAIYKKDFQIFQEPGKPPVNITDNNFKDKVRLCFLNGNHYDSVYPIGRIKSAALCQSIVYEMLYEDVFKVDHGALCQRVSRPADFLSDDSMAACASSDGSDLETDEPLWLDHGTSTSTKPNNQSHRGRGRGRQLPERVRRSLNPTLLRNVEFDVWNKSKRAQQKMDYCIAAGMQYTVGDRCQVRLEGTGRSYSATVKEVPPNENLVIVHIEELGKRSVPLWSLRPPAAENSWCTVVNKDKRLSNGSGDWEERGKGRGRGKPVPPPSSSQASPPGSSGRVLKQHSWPPQATVEEQGGAKPSRKSGSLSEIGLTAKQRTAKEEEERNVALVEIQLRDEHSFPALGTGSQGDGGRKKGTEKRPSLGNKTKSPVDDIRAASPSAGERPKSSTPPPISTTVTTAPSTTTSPNLPAAKPAASPSSTCSSTNTTASPTGSAPGLTPICASPTTKTKAQSLHPAARVSTSSLPPAAAPSAKPCVTGGALSQSVPCSAAIFSFHTPALPTASAALSSSSAVPPKLTASPPPPSSIPPPTFIAPIAPSPAQGFLPPSSLHRSSPPVSSLPHSPSPPSSLSSSHIHHAAQVRESPSQKPLPNSGGISVAKPQTSLTPASWTKGDVQTQPCLPKHQSQNQAALIQSQIQMPLIQKEIQSSIPLKHQPQPLTEVPQTQAYLPQNQASLPQNQASLPQNQASLPQTQAYLPQNQACLTQTQACLPQTQASLPQTQASLPQNQACLTQTQACLPQTQASLPQTQAFLPQNQPYLPPTQAYLPPTQAYLPPTQAYLPPTQASLPQTQASLPPNQMPVPQHSSSQSQSDMVHIQSSHPHPGASYLHTSQASIPVSTSGYLQLSHHQSHPAQPPHPSQLPHPSLCIPASPNNPSLQTENHTESPQHPPQPESPHQPPAHPGHPPHPAHHPHFLSAPHPQSIQGAVPLQNLSQLYQDPLYPGFPRGQKGDMVPTPPYSSIKSGDDLPQDVNILRFFFNMGIKAYSMPMYPPYIYLLPLQQAHSMQPKLPSRSPSPNPHFPPTRHQEAYPPNHQTSVPAQHPYGHQAALTEPHRPSEPSFNQAGYHVTQPPPHRMPCNSPQWRQHPMPPPSTSSYQVGYPTSTSPYQLPPPSQGYHPGQGTGHPFYPPTMTSYPPSSLGYQSSSNPDELQGVMEQLQPTNGDALSGHGPGQVPGPLDGSAAANLANANHNRMVVSCVNNFALKEQGESQRRTVLLVDPPLNNTPILTLVSNSDDPGSMTTMKPSSTPGTPSPYGIIPKDTVPGDNNASLYQVHPKQSYYNKPYARLGVKEHGKAGHLQTMPMTEGLSMGCSTEDDWEEREGFKPANVNPRGSKKIYRGGRGRPGGYDGGRGGQRRRQGGEGFNHGQFGPSHRGRGW